jgi:hypothetical protein
MTSLSTPQLFFVTPAKAGAYPLTGRLALRAWEMDPRLRGDDELWCGDVVQGVVA